MSFYRLLGTNSQLPGDSNPQVLFLINQGAKSLHHTPTAIGNLPVHIQACIEEFFRDTGYDVSSPSLSDDSEVDGRSNGEPNLFLGSQTLDTRLSDALRKNDNTKI
jgi:hypothetical protein